MAWALSRQASLDVDAIIRYTDANFGTAQTEEHLGGLYNNFDLLSDNPGMGRAWNGSRRCYIYRQHYLFSRLSGDEVFITHIRNTRQRLPEGWGKS